MPKNVPKTICEAPKFLHLLHDLAFRRADFYPNHLELLNLITATDKITELDSYLSIKIKNFKICKTTPWLNFLKVLAKSLIYSFIFLHSLGSICKSLSTDYAFQFKMYVFIEVRTWFKKFNNYFLYGSCKRFCEVS